jgi:hypothetical protein
MLSMVPAQAEPLMLVATATVPPVHVPPVASAQVHDEQARPSFVDE